MSLLGTGDHGPPSITGSGGSWSFSPLAVDYAPFGSEVPVPIFGDLEDFGLPDVLIMIGKRSGTLELKRVPEFRKPISISVTNGAILWIFHGSDVLDPLQARSLLNSLLRTPRGDFRFVPQLLLPEGNTASRLHWPFEQALLTAAQEEDEWRAYAPSFDDPRTKFEPSSLEIWLDDALYEFWQRAKDLLQQNAVSAEELSTALKLPLEQTQYYLHKLRLVGKIRPMRSFHSSAESKRGLWQRVLAALRRSNS